MLHKVLMNLFADSETTTLMHFFQSFSEDVSLNYRTFEMGALF